MNFGQAINMVINGKKVTRKGWNNKKHLFILKLDL